MGHVLLFELPLVELFGEFAVGCGGGGGQGLRDKIMGVRVGTGFAGGPNGPFVIFGTGRKRRTLMFR